MQKTLTFLFSVLFIFSLFLSSTESFALTPVQTINQIQAVADLSFAPECVELKNNLTFRDRDSLKNGEVTKLQNFLISQGHFKDSATGYFGIVTTKAVAEFQKTQNITPALGYFGPLTKAKIKALTCVTIQSCPDGYTGTYPNCVEIKKECPTGYYGKYPDCKIAICDYAAPPEGCNYVKGPDYNSLNQCGMVLQCVDDVKVCPTGTTGTYPNCVKDPVASCIELSNNLIFTDRDSNKNGEITKLQNLLITQGYLKENPTGYFGTSTVAAVIKFQKANNINPAVGIVGPSTRAKIKALTCFDTLINNISTIKVISPNGGQSWKPSDTAKITWTTDNTPADSWVALFLQNKEGQTQLLAQKLSVNGSYDYLVSDIFCAGDACNPDPINGDFKIIARLYTGSQELCGGLCYYEPGTRIEPILITEDVSDQSFKIQSSVILIPYCPVGTTGNPPNCVTTVVPKPTVTLKATPDSVQNNQTTALTWTSTNATVCTASGGWTGTKATSGTQVISNLQTTTTFNLSCVGIGGLTAVSTDVGVYIIDYFPDPVCPTGTTGTYPNCVTTINPIPTVSLTATPESVQNNQTTALTWTSTNATSCTASGGWTGTKATSGTQVISNLQNTTTFTLTCVSPDAWVVASVDVGVYVVDNFPDPICPAGTTGTYPNCITTISYPVGCTSNTGFSTTTGQPCDGTSIACPAGTTGVYPNCVTTVTPTPKPTVTITASPSTVPFGGQTTLTWSSTNATTCVASNSWSGSKNTSGTNTFGIYINNSSTYGISCTGIGGTTTASATVSVASDANTSYPAGCTSNTGFSTITGQSCSGSATVPSDPSVDTTPRVSIWGGKVPQYLNAQGVWVSDLTSLTVHSNEVLKFCQKWYPSTTSYTTYKTEFIPNWVNFSTRAEEVFYSPHFSYKCVGGVQPTVLGASTNVSNSCSISQTLMKGMNNDEVKCLQQKLNQKGYTVSGTEGGKEVTQFGVATLSALRKFQAENGLTVDGILGLGSRNKINQ